MAIIEPLPMYRTVRIALSMRLQCAHLSGTTWPGANLIGAYVGREKLALLIDIVWSGTTCPDETLSDVHDGTCIGDLESMQSDLECPYGTPRDRTLGGFLQIALRIVARLATMAAVR